MEQACMFADSLPCETDALEYGKNVKRQEVYHVLQMRIWFS